MSKTYKGAWPPPVYVGTFANGDVGRASFSSPYGKPLDFAAGRRMVCHLYRDWLHLKFEERTKMQCATYASIAASIERYHTLPPRTDLVSGYVEFDGQTFPDMFDAPVKKVASLSPVDKLIASINKLGRADLARVREALGVW